MVVKLSAFSGYQAEDVSFIGMPLGHHTLLSLEGDLWAFGSNDESQLGLGHKNDQMQPTRVPWDGPEPVQVDWGYAHSLVLDAEGGVWEAGRSRFSCTFQKILELPPITLVAAGVAHSAAIDTEGGLWVWTSETDLLGEFSSSTSGRTPSSHHGGLRLQLPRGRG